MGAFDKAGVVTGAGDCRGVFIRFHRSAYFSRNAINYHQRLQVLERMSCPGGCEGGCDRMAFDEDITAVGVDEFPLSTRLDLEHTVKSGDVYRLLFVPLGTDWETGHLDDWEWKLVQVQSDAAKEHGGGDE